jgi:hypothetical protein
MSISTASLAFAIPAVTKVATATIESVGQGLSFAQLFGQKQVAENTAVEQAPTIRQQLDSLAGGLRNWLQGQGIQTPFEITVSPSSMDSNSQLSVRGPEASKISQLLSQNPEKITALKRLASSIQAAASSLGNGAASVSVTDLDSGFTY